MTTIAWSGFVLLLVIIAISFLDQIRGTER